MRFALDIAKLKKTISNEYYNSSITLLSKFALTYVLPATITQEQLMSAMLFDKKVVDNKIRFVLPIEKGKVMITSDVKL